MTAPPRALDGARTALAQAEAELQEAGSALERADHAKVVERASVFTRGLAAIDEDLSVALPARPRRRR
jgi:hypothetical protein